jgi:hypothetical protein
MGRSQQWARHYGWRVQHTALASTGSLANADHQSTATASWWLPPTPSLRCWVWGNSRRIWRSVGHACRLSSGLWLSSTTSARLLRQLRSILSKPIRSADQQLDHALPGKTKQSCNSLSSDPDPVNIDLSRPSQRLAIDGGIPLTFES